MHSFMFILSVISYCAHLCTLLYEPHIRCIVCVDIFVCTLPTTTVSYLPGLALFASSTLTDVFDVFYHDAFFVDCSILMYKADIS